MATVPLSAVAEDWISVCHL